MMGRIAPPWARGLQPLQVAAGGPMPATRLLLASFAGMIAVGTLGLLLLPGLYAGPQLGLVDALFTATSAVCVTGLIVVDTATYFTPLGQAWIALLIQLGGLGILTFTTVAISALGWRTSLEAEEAAAGHASILGHVRPLTLVKGVLITTFGIELLGALVLWIAWRAELGTAGAVWPAFFHAISAFCNAGFSVFSDSLVGFRGDGLTVYTASLLIVVGGIGFLVLLDLWSRWVRRDVDRLSTHTRLALAGTALLLAGSTVLFLGFEAGNELRTMSWPDRLANAWFMGVTPRTAGFNTVDYAAVTDPSLFLTIILMVVGGSPGSAAGGLKTTTVAVLALVLWSRLRGKGHVSFFGRTIPESTVQRAAGLTVGGIAVLTAGVFLLLLLEAPAVHTLERTRFLRLAFEAHSAFGTVGLSMGATPELSSPGRLVTVVLMYVGRVGPLAVASAMAVAGGRRVRYRYAHEDVAIG